MNNIDRKWNCIILDRMQPTRVAGYEKKTMTPYKQSPWLSFSMFPVAIVQVDLKYCTDWKAAGALSCVELPVCIIPAMIRALIPGT